MRRNVTRWKVTSPRRRGEVVAGFAAIALVCGGWLTAASAQTPFVVDEWKYGKRQESNTLHYCVDGRDPDLPVARKVGAAIAGALLLTPKEHTIGENAVGDDVEYLYRIFLESC